MGQCATLYRIGQADFSNIVEHSEDMDLSTFHKGYRIFDKSHEGLRYVLSKNQDENISELVEQIFYPHNHIGDLPSLEDVDFQNLPDDFDFEGYDKAVNSLVSYNPPEIVKAIAAFLGNMSAFTFSSRFDHEELNREGIYPYDIWNNETDEDVGFNVRDMTEQFIQLNNFYKAAAKDGDYVLSFVG